MRTLMNALLMSVMILTPVSAYAGSKPKVFKTVDEKSRDAKNNNIIIRRQLDRNGNVIRTFYYVQVGSYGMVPGELNKKVGIVEPYFEPLGRKYY